MTPVKSQHSLPLGLARLPARITDYLATPLQNKQTNRQTTTKPVISNPLLKYWSWKLKWPVQYNIYRWYRPGLPLSSWRYIPNCWRNQTVVLALTWEPLPWGLALMAKRCSKGFQGREETNNLLRCLTF